MKQKLQILICTIGEAGIHRIVEANHPVIPGVEYLIAWQQPDSDISIPIELERPDFKFIINKDTGISVNRNHALDALSAPLAIMSDDDVTFSPSEILHAISIFGNNPDLELATFKFHCAQGEKNYPTHEFNLRSPKKGYYPSIIEIMFRTAAVKGKVLFNNRFGFGTDFLGGEDGIFIHDALKAGIECRYLPHYICRHDSVSTGIREKRNPLMVISKGAQFCIYHPNTWPLRMLAHAFRQRKNFPFLKYCNLWLQGRRLYRNG